MSKLLDMLFEHKIIAIFRGYKGPEADAAALALIEGGIRLMEVTMNTEEAAETISAGAGSMKGERRLVPERYLMWRWQRKLWLPVRVF